MNKYLRLIFFGCIPVLALIVGKAADTSVSYFLGVLSWSSSTLVMVAVVCLAVGAIAMFRLIGSRLDNAATWVWIMIGCLLTSLGVGWIIGSIVYATRSP